MRATIKICAKENRKMLCVPTQSLIFDKNKNFVMIFKDSAHIDTREVDIFRQVGDLTFIANGIDEHDKVITENQLLIYDALND